VIEGCNGQGCEIEGGGQEQWLVRHFVRTPLLHRRGADIEVVKAFDGGCEEHGVRKARILLEGKRKNRLLAAARVGDDQAVAVVHGREEVFPVDPCGVTGGGDSEIAGLSWKLNGEVRVGFQIQGQEQETFGLVIQGGEEVAKDRRLGRFSDGVSCPCFEGEMILNAFEEQVIDWRLERIGQGASWVRVD